MANSLIQFRAEDTLKIKAASRIAEENGISDMTLDEINAEIAEARK